MSPHWALAARGAAATIAVALPAAGFAAYYLGAEDAVAFLYGVGVGLAVFAAIAASVSLITVRPSGGRVLIGTGLYLGRLAFAAAAIGVPAYLGSLPVLPMVSGFAGVYIVENVALLWGASRVGLPTSSRRREERRVEV